MALAIATNSAALQAAASASSVNRDMETSMARLASGMRINSASDDAAGVAIASRLSSEIRGTDQAIRNALDGQAVIDSAEGAHKEIEAILQRMREVAVQAANDTNSADDRANLQAEMNALMTEIDRIASVTTWAGQSLMSNSGSTSNFSFQVGTATGDKNQIAINIKDMSTDTTAANGGLELTTAVVAATNHDADNDITMVGGTHTHGTNTVAITNAAHAATPVVASVTFKSAIDGLSANKTISSTTLGLDSDDSPSAAAKTANQTILAAEIVSGINSDTDLIKLGISATLDGTDRTKFVIDYGTHRGHLLSSTAAKQSIANIDIAIKNVNTQRSELGAVSNRLSHTVANLTNISANLSAAKGGIEDADFAVETTELAKNQILQQASTAMLAQANASKANVLSLLQG